MNQSHPPSSYGVATERDFTFSGRSCAARPTARRALGSLRHAAQVRPLNNIAATLPAFSMVELLTVIGIIAVLIAILMPTLTKARQASQFIVCRSNLRQIYQAALMFSSEHHGFMQIAGKMNGASATPADMGDADQTKYLYFTDNGAPRPAPYPVALGRYLGSNIRLDSADNLLADFTSPSCVARKIFTCPSRPDPTPGQTVSGELDGWYAPRLPISYAYNEGVLGFEANSDRRLRGQFNNARPASEILFLTDAIPRTDPNQSAYIAWYPADTGRSTLADAYTGDNGMPGMAEQFDIFRHQGKINVAYFDGHVDSLYITDDDLQHGIILPQ